uniref:F-box domain-containing protein n=1 Tax=Meloidogyne javanica TaxID=6303 RepID=A0A915LGU2_MELJA
MPFIGKDWRAPGDLWVRVNHVNHTAGWELIKLHLLPKRENSSNSLNSENSVDSPPSSAEEEIEGELNTNLRQKSEEEENDFSLNEADILEDEEDEDNAEDEDNEDSDDQTNITDRKSFWSQPYCFVKLKNRSKEFIGCTSMSEAFHRLDMARAVVDIRRFNYICKVVQILVNEKLHNLSASSRKILFAIIQAMVLHSVENDMHITTTKVDILKKFNSGLDSPHVCGSPQLVSKQQGTCTNLLDLIAKSSAPHTLSEANPENITFLDLPREVLSLILSKLPDHVSLLEAAKANETLQALYPEQSWRDLFFELKKYYGLRETYADLVVVCCHCKALFWKDHGHPCVSKDAPSVRFVDMLLFL